MSEILKIKDGFEGEKFISIPPRIWLNAIRKDPQLFQFQITHIGYFPRAQYHYRERIEGCDDNILIYCIKGKGHYIIADKEFKVVANQVIIIPATDQYIRYWADNEDPWTIYWVHFTGSNIGSFNHSLQLNITKGPIEMPFNEKSIEVWHNIYQSLEMGFSKENLCNASFCLYYFLATFLFSEKHIATVDEEKVDFITETILHMKANLDKKLTVEDMASQHRLSSSYFSSLFRKGTGMSPIDYFTHLKMQKACQLLYATNSKIKAIAENLGYEDPYYFSRAFKKNMGLSPEQYRLGSKKTF